MSLTTGGQIKQIMEEHGLTRRQVCEYFHFKVHANGSNGTLDKWLSGTRNPPAYAVEYLRVCLGAHPPAPAVTPPRPPRSPRSPRGLTIHQFKDTHGGRHYTVTHAQALQGAAPHGTTWSVAKLTVPNAQALVDLLQEHNT